MRPHQARARSTILTYEIFPYGWGAGRRSAGTGQGEPALRLPAAVLAMLVQGESVDRKARLEGGQPVENAVQGLVRYVVRHGDVRVVREAQLAAQQTRPDVGGQQLALGDASGHRDEHDLGDRTEGAGTAQVQLVGRMRLRHG